MSAGLACLTADESERLADLEAVVRSGLDTFVIVGRALAEIRDARLYRASHGTFESYCEQQWSLSRPRAYQLIEAAGVVEALSTNVDTPVPANEGQARQLTGLPAGTAAEVMRRAHDETGGKLTAAAIREARQAVAPRPQPDALAEKIAAELAASDADYAAMASASDEEFEDAITAARSEGELSRQNVVAKLTEPSPAVTDYLESSQALKDSGYVREFMGALHRSHAVLRFDPQRLAGLLDEAESQAVADHAASLARFTDALRRGRSGLRVINGGK